MAPSCPTMNEALQMSKYAPVEPLSHYGMVHILDTGKVRLTDPLSDDIIAFLKTIEADVSLWDGSKGLLGREYTSNVTPSVDLTKEEIDALRRCYNDVKENLSAKEVLQNLKTELDKLYRMQRELKMKVFEMEQKVEKLRQQQDDCEIKNGEHSETYKTLTRRIEKITYELKPCLEALERLETKMQQKIVDITESETGFVRRIALLQRMFSCERTIYFIPDSEEKDEAVRELRRAEDETRQSSQKLQQIKRFYVDATTGMAHLYQIESLLKSVLENLREGMNSLQGRYDPTYHGPLETGFEFRVGYVRKLWNRVETGFRHTLPYIKQTSLQYTRGSFGTDEAGEQQKTHKLSRLSSGSGSGSGSGERRKGIFDGSQTLLPSFTKIELSHPISRRSRISALHKNAARAYRDVNELYDFHEQMTKEAFAMLQTVEREDQRVSDYLIAVCERLLELCIEQD